MRVVALILAGLSGALIGFLLGIGVASAAPRGAPDSEGSPALLGASQNDVHVGSGEHKAGAAELPTARYGEASPATESGAPTPLLRGSATWYCGNGSPCTHGYGPSDMVAAIDPSLGIPKGTLLRVRYSFVDEDGNEHNYSVVVQVVDVCACPGRRVIDLTSGAFARLAPLSRGVIAVSLEEVGPTVTIPPTDTSEVKP